MIDILHTADWHSNSDYDRFMESTEYIKDYIIHNNTNLMVHSGDLFDSKIIASDEYNKIINRFIEFADLLPIFMVYGTPSHDYKNSLDILRTVKTKYPIYIVDDMRESTMYFVKGEVKSYFTKTYIPPQGDEIVRLVGLAWQSKNRFLKDSEMLELNSKEQNELFRKRFLTWRKIVLEEKNKYNVPTILVAHLQLIGTVPSLNQDISSDNHDPKDYYDLCDYGALGHIHKAQKNKHLYYSGSIYNKSWGELDDKFFNVLSVENNSIVDIEQIQIPTPALLKIDCNIDEYKEIKKEVIEKNQISADGNIFDLNKPTNLWIIINVENSKILNYEKEEKFWETNVNVIRLEFSKIKTDAVQRLESYSNEMSLVEKFKLWCSQKDVKPSEFQINKIKEFE
jgi:DNA repair exonuclease SbcCD nuclease subunit